MFSQLTDLLLQLHQRQPHLLDLRVVERAAFHAANRLTLEKFAQEFDETENQARQSLLDVLRIAVEALRGSARDRRKLLVETFDGLSHLVRRDLFRFVAQGQISAETPGIPLPATGRSNAR